jgi:hypothetical protein
MCFFAEEFFEAEIGEGIAIALFHGSFTGTDKNKEMVRVGSTEVLCGLSTESTRRLKLSIFTCHYAASSVSGVSQVLRKAI